MAVTTELVYMREKAVYNLQSGAQGAAKHPAYGEKVSVLLYEASSSLGSAVDSLRGAPGARPADTAGQALRRLSTALEGLRPHLARGTNAGEQLALAKWLCDTVLCSAAGKTAVAPV